MAMLPIIASGTLRRGCGSSSARWQAPSYPKNGYIELIMPTIQATPSFQFVLLKVVVKTYSEVFFLDVTPSVIRTARNPKIWRAPGVVRACLAKGRKEGRRGEHTGDKVRRREHPLADNVQHCTVDQNANVDESGVPSLWVIGWIAEGDETLDHEARIKTSRRK